MSRRRRISWPSVLEGASRIVLSYETGVTLRQLFYRLVAAEILPNTIGAYKTLSARTAEARRVGEFPDLIDRGRSVSRPETFEDPGDARSWLREIYRRDRTEGQSFALYLGVEKAGMLEQFSEWFGALGIPVLALAGYSSQTFVDDVIGDVARDGRPGALLYGGDFDPSGEDIDRDFLERSGCFRKAIRVALTSDQVIAYGLPPLPGKATDSRSSAFVSRHGRLVQVELDALPPDVLRGLFEDALAEFWDTSAYEASVARENAEREELDR